MQPISIIVRAINVNACIGVAWSGLRQLYSGRWTEDGVWETIHRDTSQERILCAFNLPRKTTATLKTPCIKAILTKLPNTISGRLTSASHIFPGKCLFQAAKPVFNVQQMVGYLPKMCFHLLSSSVEDWAKAILAKQNTVSSPHLVWYEYICGDCLIFPIAQVRWSC